MTRKAIIYKLGDQIGTVSIKNGELHIEGIPTVERLIASLKKTDKTNSPEEFIESLPDRLRSQVYVEVIDE
jgi:hypothetical protein